MPNSHSSPDFAAAPISLWRRGMNSLATCLAATAVFLVLLPLAAIFAYLVYKGFGSINWAFLTQTPKDRKSTRLNSSHSQISYAVFCLKKKKYISHSVID